MSRPFIGEVVHYVPTLLETLGKRTTNDRHCLAAIVTDVDLDTLDERGNPSVLYLKVLGDHQERSVIVEYDKDHRAISWHYTGGCPGYGEHTVMLNSKAYEKVDSKP